MKRLHLCVVAVLLTVAVGVPAAAQDGVTVTYTVAASDLYTVTNNGGDPTITFTDCLTANHTYTLDFTVAVTTDRSITATFATVGEGSFNFIPQGFTPPTIQTSGTGTDTVNVRGTFRAGPNVFPPTEGNVVGIYLEGPNASVLGQAILFVRYACVAAPPPARAPMFLPLITMAPPPRQRCVARSPTSATATSTAITCARSRRGCSSPMDAICSFRPTARSSPSSAMMGSTLPVPTAARFDASPHSARHTPLNGPMTAPSCCGNGRWITRTRFGP